MNSHHGGDRDDTITRYLRHLTAGGARPGTVRLRRYYLRRLAEQVDLLSADTATLERFLSRPGWQPETRKSARATIVSFYGWATDAALIGADPAGRLPAVSVPRGRPRPAPPAAVRNALGQLDPRATLMVRLAYLQGLRRAEVAALHTRDLVDGQLRIRGKGGVVRVLPVHPDVEAAIAALPAGWVFPSPRGGHLQPDAVYRTVRRVTGGWPPHTLRHAAATRWHGITRDLLVVRDLLGHASVATTQRYTATEQDLLRVAITGGEAA